MGYKDPTNLIFEEAYSEMKIIVNGYYIKYVFRHILNNFIIDLLVKLIESENILERKFRVCGIEKPIVSGRSGSACGPDQLI